MFTPFDGGLEDAGLVRHMAPFSGDCTDLLLATARGAFLTRTVCENIRDCADLDGDAIRDDGCVWWNCNKGVCEGTDVVFGDMGGRYGACPPDAIADGSDHFHAMNCFANSDTSEEGLPYPCEDLPPSAFNVDTGSRRGSCEPDGVCDGSDVLLAIDAFSDSTACTCPSDGPSPDAPPGELDSPVVAGATLQLIAEQPSARRGDLVQVSAFINEALPDLRGYQLHIAITGGSHGTLELVDVAIETRRSRVFGNKRPYEAFNLSTAQALVILGPLGMPTPPTGYLATFTLRVGDDARGRFVIELLADPDNAAQRTALYPTLSNGHIAITATAAATITVQRRHDTVRRVLPDSTGDLHGSSIGP